MKWLGRALLAAVVLALLLAGFVAWVVPGIARREAARGFEQATGRKLAIGELSIHPFTWKVEVRDFAMSEVGGKGTFASFKRAEASIGLSSIWRRVPVISRVRLEGHSLSLVCCVQVLVPRVCPDLFPPSHTRAIAPWLHSRRRLPLARASSLLHAGRALLCCCVH
jgi:hypothetical protein